MPAWRPARLPPGLRPGPAGPTWWPRPPWSSGGVTYPAASATVRRLGRAALAAPLPDGVRARLFAQLATVDSYDGRTAEAERAAGEALRLATSAGDPQAVLDAVRAAEGNLLNASASAERLRLGELALEQAERLGQPLAAVLGAGWQVRGAYELGRLDLVDAAIAEMERVADASGLPVARWHAQRALAARAMLEGRFAAARQANAAALELAVASGDVVAVGMTFAAANHLAHLRGDPAEFLGGEEEQLAAAPPMPLIRTSRALMLLVLGRRDEAHAVYEELRAGLGSYPLDYRWGAVLVHLADLAVEFEDVAIADELAAGLRVAAVCPGTSGTATAYFVGSADRFLGRLAALAGRLDEAEALLRSAVDVDVGLRARPHVVLARLDLAGVLHRRGALDEAAALTRLVADEGRRLDLPGPLAAADRLAAGIVASRRNADPLTDRERQVADLVVRALSNRDIAKELVLSERTVESHVRNILAKLHLTNRTELIARGR